MRRLSPALALAVVSLGCGGATEPPKVPAPAPSASSSTHAPPPRIVGITTRSTCSVPLDDDRGFVAVLASVPTTYTNFPLDWRDESKRGTVTFDQVWWLRCDLGRAKECEGVWLNGHEHGEPLSWMNVSPITAELVAHTGAVAVVKFGPYRTFTIDAGRGKITYAESGGPLQSEGRGEADCSPKLTD